MRPNRHYKKLIVMAGLAAALAVGPSVPALKDGNQARAAQTPPIQVAIGNFTFGPATLTVKAGTTVAWTNRDDIPHTVTEVGKKFKSPVLDTDDSFAHRFDLPGTFAYFCSIHPHMTGKVVVVP